MNMYLNGEKAKIAKKVTPIEKDVKKTSALVKEKVLDHKRCS